MEIGFGGCVQKALGSIPCYTTSALISADLEQGAPLDGPLPDPEAWRESRMQYLKQGEQPFLISQACPGFAPLITLFTGGYTQGSDVCTPSIQVWLG
eukprot:scaffold191052_cov16-Tisochrysis_lutea.AAC.1